MFKIPVLFTSSNTLYNDSQFDCFNLERNAFSYTGDHPVICHPPCRLFSKLKSFSKAPSCEKLCAYYSMNLVRQVGGILEHPLGSTLFKDFDCDLTGAVDNYGGFLRKVDLSWFGFPVKKITLLYFVGLRPGDLPPFPLSFDLISFGISTNRKKTLLKELPKSLRSQTPLEMTLYFFHVMQIIKKEVQNDKK